VKRVLIVDDSPAFRMILRRLLEGLGDIEVVGEAGDPFEARTRILELHPDVVTLDVNMPRMNGEQFLVHLMQAYPLPVVVVTGEAHDDPVRAAALRAAGAVAVLGKPTARDREAFTTAFAEAIRTATKPKTIARHRPPIDLIAVGASTGGATATAKLLGGLGTEPPPIVIAQHIHPGLAESYSSWLGHVAPMRVREARDGDPLEPGLVLLPPRDRHIRVVFAHERLRIALGNGEKVNGHRPSVDVLFSSIAAFEDLRVVAVLLTGMGTDGAQGLLELRRRGARTIVQEPTDCVVPAMPESAIRLGAAQTVVPVAGMAQHLV
jgi:two-component system, chemotaxis family, protein-glutamate methylesterase/glutaminase